jgi:hypothetical protein
MDRIILKVAITHQVAHKVTTFHLKINLHNILARLALCSTVTINSTFAVVNEGSVAVIVFNLQEAASAVVVISKTCTGMPMDRMVQVEGSIQETLLHSIAHKIALLHQLLSQHHHHNKRARSRLPQRTLTRMTIYSDLRRIFKSRTRRRKQMMTQPCHRPVGQLPLDPNPTSLALPSKPLQKRQWQHRSRRYLRS